MKFKTTAIAMAVAGTVAAPVAVQAGADELYASARVGVQFVDSGDTADTNIRSFSSRFGARGETDLGNGLTGFGRYEWDVDMGEDSDGGDIGLRHRYVGLKGDFGSALVGQTYHTFYNFVVGPVDTPWWNSDIAMIAYVGRTDQGLTYAGSSDAFSFGATVYMDRDTDEEALDVYEGGASYTFGNDMVLGLGAIGTAADENDGTGTLIGNSSDKAVVAASLTGIMLGDFGFGFQVQSQDDDTSETIEVLYNNFYAHFELEQIDADSNGNFSDSGNDDQDRVASTLGYTQSLGRKTTMWYEFNYTDNDTGDDDDDSTSVMAVLKYDII